MQEFFAAADWRGIDALYAGFAEDAWQLGPLFVPQRSLGYHDLQAQGLALGSTGQAAELPLAMLAQHALCLLAQVSPVALIDRLLRFQSRLGDERQSTHYMARLPCADDPHRRGVFTYLTAVAQPPKRFCAPKSYQHHYRESNLALVGRPQSRSAGVHTVPLDEGSSGELDSGMLGRMLRSAFGEQTLPVRGGSESQSISRRIAPTGGGLRSPEAIVVIRDVASVVPGVYRYSGSQNALEKLDVPVSAVADVFEPVAGRQAQAYIAAFGNLSKVRAKYGNYALSIVGYDCGIAAQYVRSICHVAGISIRDIPFVDGGILASILGLPRSDSAFAFVEALALGEPDTTLDEALSPDQFTRQINGLARFTPPAHPGNVPDSIADTNTLHDLLALFANRRSIRSFDPGPIEYATVQSLCSKALAHCAARLSALGLDPRGIHLYAVIGAGVESLSPGIYRAEAAGNSVDFTQECPFENQAQVENLVNQDEVGQAPILIVPTVPIDEIVNQLGPRGLVLALGIGGAAVAALWLNAMQYGLAGVSYGGLIESELRARAPSMERRNLALLAFACGHAPRGGTD